MKNVLTLDKTGAGSFATGWPEAGEIANELTDHVLKLSLPEKLSSNSDLKNYHLNMNHPNHIL